MRLNKKIIAGLVALLFVGAVAVTYVAYQGSQPQDPRTLANQSPEENTFYLAKRNDEPVLFYRYAGMMVSYHTADAFTGFVINYDKPYTSSHDHNNYGDFRQMEDPQKLFTFEGFARVDNIMLSEDKTYLVMSILGGRTDSTNYIYQVNLETLESKLVWQQELRQSETAALNGTAYITNFVPDQYVAFALIKGFLSPANPPMNVIVKNLRTGDEKVLGAVGDTQIDVSTNTVSYKAYGPIQEPCIQNDPLCFATDKYKIAHKPTGQLLTQPLP